MSELSYPSLSKSAFNILAFRYFCKLLLKLAIVTRQVPQVGLIEHRNGVLRVVRLALFVVLTWVLERDEVLPVFGLPKVPITQ